MPAGDSLSYRVNASCDVISFKTSGKKNDLGQDPINNIFRVSYPSLEFELSNWSRMSHDL